METTAREVTEIELVKTVDGKQRRLIYQLVPTRVEDDFTLYYMRTERPVRIGKPVLVEITAVSRGTRVRMMDAAFDHANAVREEV